MHQQEVTITESGPGHRNPSGEHDLFVKHNKTINAFCFEKYESGYWPGTTCNQAARQECRQHALKGGEGGGNMGGAGGGGGGQDTPTPGKRHP